MSLRRGDLVTVAAKGPYTGKPRPALILQSDLLDQTASVVTCPFTTHDSTAIPTRVPIPASAANGLNEDSDLMADKIMAVARAKLGRRIGAVSQDDMVRVQEAVLVVLGFEG